MRSKLTTRKALVVIIGVMFALAWAIPSLGASAGKVARTALGRANEAFYKSNVAVSTSDTAKSTANSANATAGAANTSANQAKTAASQAQSTANSALSAATAADEVQDNFTRTYDLGTFSASECTSDTFSRLGVVTTDAVVVTPADNQPDGIITEGYTLSGSIKVVFCNVTGSTIPDPPSGSYQFTTLRP